MMVALYIACAAFGGVLLLASVLLGHGGDGADGAGAGGDGAGGSGGGTDLAVGHHPDLGQAHSHAGAGGFGIAVLLSMRFWTFALTFFGLTGLVLHGLGGPTARTAAPFVAAAAGVAAGVVASRLFAALGRQVAGTVAQSSTYIGREGTLLLPASREGRGKLRMRIGATEVDLLAETEDDDPLSIGSSVLVSAVRGQVVVVTRNPAPPARKT